MNNFEVPEQILNSPFQEPEAYWLIREGESPQKPRKHRKNYGGTALY